MFYLCFFFPKDSNIFCLIVDCEQITTLEKSGCCGNEFINVVINFFLKELVESIQIILTLFFMALIGTFSE